MKSKLLTLLAIVLLTGVFTACSEEEVTPTNSQQVLTEGSHQTDDF